MSKLTIPILVNNAPEKYGDNQAFSECTKVKEIYFYKGTGIGVAISSSAFIGSGF